MIYAIIVLVALTIGFITGFLAGGKSNRSKEVYGKWENLRSSV